MTRQIGWLQGRARRAAGRGVFLGLALTAIGSMTPGPVEAHSGGPEPGKLVSVGDVFICDCTEQATSCRCRT